jgi:cation diffusion facilitator family transporter
MKNAKKFALVPEYGDIQDPQVRAKYGYLEGIVSIIGNTVLFFIKLFFGIFINSIALIADSVHTLSDSGTSSVVIFGFKMSKKPPDKEHPFGHGRVEYIATLIIAVLLIVIGIGFIEQSVVRLLNPQDLENSQFALFIGIIIIVSALIKEFLAQFSYAIGKKIKSDVLIADAWHHRSDAIASVAVGLGIIGSYCGFSLLDPIFGLIVSFIIIYVGVDLIKKTSNLLIGTEPDDEIVDKVRKIIEPIDGVDDFDDISIHDYGTSKIISMQISVENDLTLDQAHEIANKIESSIRDNMNLATIIHLEPKEYHEDIDTTKKIVEKILEKQKEIISFHKVQIIRHGENENIKMHVIVKKDMSIDVAHKFCHRLEKIIKHKYETCDVDIHLEPCGEDCNICTFSCKRRQY